MKGANVIYKRFYFSVLLFVEMLSAFIFVFLSKSLTCLRTSLVVYRVGNVPVTKLQVIAASVYTIRAFWFLLIGND